MRSIALAEVLPVLGTGDLVLFSGKTTPSSIIKRLTLSRWSHVGMVLRSPEDDRPYLWESLTASRVPDAFDGTLKRGVMTVDLATRLRADQADLAVRRLNRPVTEEMAQRAWSLHEELADRPYEENLTELVKSAIGGFFGRNEIEDLSSIFCSELVAEAYQAMGLLATDATGGKGSNEFTPAAFAEDAELPLLGGWTLGPEAIVERR